MGVYKGSYVGAGDWYAISDGIPLYDWSAVDTANPRLTINPRMHPPIFTCHQHKAYSQRISGLDIKISKGHKISDFSDNVFCKLEEGGMDTISYISSPSNSKKMCSVIKDYLKFTANLERSVHEGKIFSETLFDNFDKTSEDAIQFLFNSLDDELNRYLRQKVKAEDPFIVH